MPARSSFYLAPGLVLLLAAVVSFVYGPRLRRTSLVLGVFRTPASRDSVSLEHFSTVENTVHCEDLHYHESSKMLFTASSKAQGSVKVIDPKTLKATTLRFDNFGPPFVTHGIDVIDDPDRQAGEAVYIFAVNHKPSSQHYEKANVSAPKSHSVVEVFHHVIGSESIRHVRSVWDPLIRTPNDILALSPTSFFVTNDHHYREGWLRMLEDVNSGARWSNTIYVEFPAGGERPAEDYKVKASVALTGLHNNNGLGHGDAAHDVLLGSAASGTLHLGRVQGVNAARSITVVESIELDSSIDNPSYFADPFANGTFDASGFVVCGLTRAIDLGKNCRDPQAKDGVMVWKVAHQGGRGQQESKVESRAGSERWSKRLLFQDDGRRIRSSSSAVLIATDPAINGGRRRAQLFVTGFLSRNIVSVGVDL
ncbi:hypothetical protein G6O67_006608 [Ophiocordyceps sinensis]|uniref:Serum paraoxonase/arylesterase family protein n=1 Tax=Ophiocordyceps sinensis TaxID=72228 RepID=A0A8H4LWU7_9HYPO|nr:hypothetical protein G6O67_006608 [Ophiocordyceps sinensis]